MRGEAMCFSCCREEMVCLGLVDALAGLVRADPLSPALSSAAEERENNILHKGKTVETVGGPGEGGTPIRMWVLSKSVAQSLL